MSGKSLITTAVLLIVVAGVPSFSDERNRNVIEIETKKVVLTDSSRPQADATKAKDTITRTARVLFITAKGCERCEKELSRLSNPGGEFEVMRSLGWKIGDSEDSHIQIVDRDKIPMLVELLKVREYPTVACIENGQIVRSFKEGCTTPLDSWTFGWLLKGQNERPQSAIPEAARVATTGNYRLRGNHWTLEGDPNPSKQAVLNHLRGPNHGHAAPAYGALETWSYEELRSLHDDLHEREGGTYGNFAQPQFRGTVAANQNLAAFSGNRKVTGK
jgi:hypothetical protein